MERPSTLPGAQFDTSVPPPGYPALASQPPPVRVVHRQPMIPLPSDPSHRHSFHGSDSFLAVHHPVARMPKEGGETHHFQPQSRPVSLLPDAALRAHDKALKCAPRKRFSASNFSLGPLPEFSERMAGRDVDASMQQGADINSESPRAGSMASLVSVNSSASQEKRSTPPHHGSTPTVMGPGGVALEGRVLVDPSTGQHYIVPAQTPGMFYQPVYYPPHYGYYAPMSQQGYPQGQAFAVPQYRYPPPPHATPPQYRHPPFTAMTSLNSHASSEDLRSQDAHRYSTLAPSTPQYSDPDQPPGSPSQSARHPIAPFPYPQYHPMPPMPQRMSPPQPEDPKDPFRRDSIRSSSEFVRQGSGEFSRGNSSTSLEKAGGLAWWGRPQPTPAQDSQTDVESSSPRRSPPASAASDNEAARRAQLVEQPPPPRVAQKSVRLDFDFTKPMPEEVELEREKAKEKEKREREKEKTATAFTVTFDDDKTASASLQDAARKSGAGRRLLNRRVQPAPPPKDDSNKHYLLNKLLQGNATRLDSTPLPGPLSSNSSSLTPENTPQLASRENDAISEAGTFVIGAGESKTKMVAARALGNSSSDSDSDSTSSADSSTPPRTAVQRDPSPRRTASGVAGRNSTDSDSALLLQELLALKRAQARPSTSQVSPTARGRTASTHQQQQQQHQLTQQQTQSSRSAGTPTSASSNFRRADGGRFSMRTGVSNVPSSPQMAKKPPFRVGVPSNRPPPPNPHVVAQREQEMTAWLRRKDYNPRKAVEDAKKAKEQKASNTSLAEIGSSSTEDGNAEMLNRSTSYLTESPVRRAGSPGISLSRNKSDESLVHDGASTASQKVLAEYSRGVVKNISELTQRSRSGDKKNNSGLDKAVDILWNKCNKSIGLIRSQNKGCLSVSVEDLLATAAEPPRATESLEEQLARLSDAFDAVQRYLEQYSLDSRGSPPVSDAEEDTTSLVSGFSGIGLRGKPRHQQSMATGSLVGSRDMGQARAQRTTAYRSRILAMQRDSGQTHLGKNN